MLRCSELKYRAALRGGARPAPSRTSCARRRAVTAGVMPWARARCQYQYC